MNAKLNQAGEMIGAKPYNKVYGNIGIIDREESANISGSRPTVINLGLTTSTLSMVSFWMILKNTIKTNRIRKTFVNACRIIHVSAKWRFLA
ncbi:MAG: hypothetical protein ACLUIQ_03535 [Dialister invisus]